jgi:DNA-binding helix-hairpin-helix protein with protein kinase domain
MPAARQLWDHQGRPIDLGPLLASGGEGAVHTVAGDPGLLAKVYHRPPDPDRGEKLRWMTAHAAAEVSRFAAWPAATLHDGEGGPLVGFLMPRFAGYRAIHTLYSPAHRRTAFPTADWAFLIHTAMNCAAAFDALHAAGHVIGDVNQSNLLVSEKALVGLIDCDSFQVTADGRLFPCDVGVSPYTPPELQGQSLRGVVRTPNHDRFGLAVLVFHLLFMGRHPFAGRFLGKGEMPLEQAIAEHRFVYGRDAQALQMAPPPNALAPEVLSPELRQLFERAFGRGSAAEGARPAAAEWQAALAAFVKQLRTCPRDAGHKVPAHVLECPWCALMQTGAPNFFLGVSLDGGSFDVDAAFLGRVAERLAQVQRRRFAPPRVTLPRRLPAATPPARRGGIVRRIARPIGWAALAAWVAWLLYLCGPWETWLPLLGAAVVLSVVYFLLRRSPAMAEAARRRQALHAARAELQAAVAEWRQVADRYEADYRRLRDRLRQLHDQYCRLPARYEAERPQNDRETYFRNQYLRTCFISDHDIDRIGPGRKALLASYGIETAADVEEERLLGVRGIGPVLAGNLLAWRRKMLAQFKYDPQAPVPEADTRAVVLKYKQLEEGLRGQLQRGVSELETLGGRTEEQLRPVQTSIETVLTQAAQAEADLRTFAG